MPEEELAIETPKGPTSGLLRIPGGARAGLALAHGAGGTMRTTLLDAFCGSIADAGVATLRFNFLYSERGRRAPDPPATLIATWRAAFEAMRERVPGAPGFAGGKSLGGRIASMAAADEVIHPRGLVFLGYPLHPPGKPERVRDEHLYRLRIPMLFLQGTSDPFARSDVLEPVLGRLGSLATYVPIERGDHSFRVRGAKRDDAATGEKLAADTVSFVDRILRN
jgi:uncharacterized protein